MDFRSNALNAPARLTARLIALLALVALGAQALVTAALYPEYSALDTAWHMLRYFTNLTALLALVTFAGMGATRRGAHRLWLGGLALWEGMTAAIYHLLLAREGLTGLELWADHGLHTVLPGAVLLWWLVFARKDRMRPWAAVAWLVWPGIYIGYALARGQSDGFYPYFFLDPEQVRWDGVAVWSGMIGLGFFAGGLVLLFLARLLRR
ncbi:Pr6Pr family membrane protein [Pseudooceanicola marinus]|uniref:Pr6Pr family membrane protein n=1 Tax=Pseudooceanicola marinus TaxID=396013 RepID=UPI001CD51A71|nr:Pr6Pr family membrane protein [Pseudooceanicola marinus]MCA1335685.1 Pr6Pr family membrane protein [Pseudooceanicola marinus]